MLLRQILGFVSSQRRLYLLGFLALLATDIAGLYATHIQTKVLGDLQKSGADPAGLYKALLAAGAIYLAVVGAMAICRYWWRMYFLRACHKIARGLRRSLYEKLGRLPLGFFHRTPTGDILSRATNDLEAIRMMFGPGIFAGIDTLFYLVVVPPILLVTSWKLSLIVLATMPVLYGVVRFFQNRVDERWTAVQSQLSVVSSKVQENASGMRVVKAYNQEKAESAAFRAITEDFYGKQERLTRIQAVFGPLLVCLARLDLALVLGFGGWFYLRGEMDLFQLVRFLFFLGNLVWPMMGVGHVISLFQQGTVSLRRFNALLEEPVEDRLRGRDGNGRPPAVPHGAIEIRRLTFTYPGTDRKVLDDLSVSIPAQSTVALVGSVGSGKSTLAHLVARLHEPPRGTIFIDGKDVRDLELDALRRSVGFVPQNPFLFSDTVRENLAFADPAGIPIDRVRWSAQVSQIAAEIERLPERYEQMLGERGVNLSGGQRQRATIARALLARPRILVLDDCLASVDLETEHRILQELKPLLKETTCLWITHRVLSTRHTDWIVVLAEGRIAEQGKFEDLRRAKGVFERLVRRQVMEEGSMPA